MRLLAGSLLALGSTLLAGVAAGAPSAPLVLARVPAAAGDPELALPAHVRLRAPDGSDYALVFAPAERLAYPARALPIATSASAREFVVAREMRAGARRRAAGIAPFLFDDGRNVVVRADAEQAEALAAAGFEILRLPERPMAAPRAAPLPRVRAARDEGIAGLVAGIDEEDLSALVGSLSGERLVTVGGAEQRITTRHTRSGAGIASATLWTAELLASWGYAPSFHEWEIDDLAGRNVVAERTGAVRPAEIVVVCAHLDDMPFEAVAPGADDNASGSAGVLLSARSLASGRFERTVRFVLFTGEEQGLHGSAAYAALLSSQGANVVAVLNLDMIGWDGTGGPVLRLHTRSPQAPGYAGDLAIAGAFRAAVADYVGDALTPVVDSDGLPYSDHYSFWYQGWPAILAIEDDVDDFTPHYHTPRDTLATLDLGYATAFVKAAVATAAHLATPSPPPAPARPALFSPLAPCRVVDTRDPERPSGLGLPALGAWETRTFRVASTCGVPADATALAANVTVAEAAAAGSLTIWPTGDVRPVASAVSFAAGRIRACFSAVTLGAGATFEVYNGSPGAVHVVVDVAGAFR
jgi:hypothetical protein